VVREDIVRGVAVATLATSLLFLVPWNTADVASGPSTSFDVPVSTKPTQTPQDGAFNEIGPGSAVISLDAPSPDANFYGAILWASQHRGVALGYYMIPRADQVTWNSVAIHAPNWSDIVAAAQSPR